VIVVRNFRCDCGNGKFSGSPCALFKVRVISDLRQFILLSGVVSFEFAFFAL
jgi:hypothetical protein